METCLKINTILILKARPKVDIITPRVSVSVYNGNAATNPPNTAPTSSFDRDYWQQVVPPPLGTCLVGSDDGDDIDIEKERESERGIKAIMLLISIDRWHHHQNISAFLLLY